MLAQEEYQLFSQVSQNQQVTLSNTVISACLVPSESNNLDAEKFARLSEEWENETGGLSNSWQRMRHPAFRQIMGMQERAIPFMLKDFQRGRYEDWFMLLSLLTGANPIPPGAAGKKSEMAKAWIQWGKDNNYLID